MTEDDDFSEAAKDAKALAEALKIITRYVPQTKTFQPAYDALANLNKRVEIEEAERAEGATDAEVLINRATMRNESLILTMTEKLLDRLDDNSQQLFTVIETVGQHLVTEKENRVSEIESLRSIVGKLLDAMKEMHSSLEVMNDTQKTQNISIEAQAKRIATLEKCIESMDEESDVLTRRVDALEAKGQPLATIPQPMIKHAVEDINAESGGPITSYPKGRQYPQFDDPNQNEMGQ